MNFGELKTQVNTLVSRSAVDQHRFTDAEVGRQINRAYESAVVGTGALEQRIGVTAVSGQGVYTLPGTVVSVFRVSFDGYPLDYTTTLRLDRTDDTWRIQTGTPGWWMYDGQDGRTIRVWPTPSVAGGGAVFDMETGKITDIEGDDAFVFNNEIGRVTAIDATDDAFVFSSEYGRIVDIEVDDDDIEVWAKINPATLMINADVPDIPLWSHPGLGFLAASYLLENPTDNQNYELAAIYKAMAGDYAIRLQQRATARLHDRVAVVGRGARAPRELVRDLRIPAP